MPYGAGFRTPDLENLSFQHSALTKTGLVITAAGSGQRFGNPAGKQFIRIHSIPLFIHTCRCFSHLPLRDVVITAAPDKVHMVRELLAEYAVFGQYQVIEGGETRTQSVRRGVAALQKTDVVLIHDAARPLVSPGLLNRLLEAAQTHAAVIPGLPLSDTVKEIRNGFVVKTLPRHHLVTVQTPQVFHYDVLQDIYRQMGHGEATDEAGLAEQAGVAVRVVDGDVHNIKLTYPEDLEIITKRLMS